MKRDKTDLLCPQELRISDKFIKTEKKYIHLFYLVSFCLFVEHLSICVVILLSMLISSCLPPVLKLAPTGLFPVCFVGGVCV